MKPIRQTTSHAPVIQAGLGDLDRLMRFYDDIIDHFEGYKGNPGWTKGVYPTEAMVNAAIESDEMFLVPGENGVLAAMILNRHGEDAYDTCEWPSGISQQDAFVVHLLATSPRHRGEGLAYHLLDFACTYAREAGGRVLRLDVLVGNHPASSLYKGYGFRHVKTTQIYYVDTGWTDYELYELPL